MYYIYIKEITNPLRNQTMNLENIINENMKRFGTKNLSESDLKRIEEQQTGESITAQWSKVKLSNQYARTKYKAKTSDGTGSSLAFDYQKPGTAEKQKGTYYMTITPNPRVFANTTEYPFTSLTVTYDPFNSPDKISVDVENLNKANLKAKGFDYKALVSDTKRTVARQHVKFPPTK